MRAADAASQAHTGWPVWAVSVDTECCTCEILRLCSPAVRALSGTAAVHVANSKDLEIGVNLSGKRAGFTRHCGYLHAISCPSIYSALSLPLGDLKCHPLQPQ